MGRLLLLQTSRHNPTGGANRMGGANPVKPFTAEQQIFRPLLFKMRSPDQIGFMFRYQPITDFPNFRTSAPINWCTCSPEPWVQQNLRPQRLCLYLSYIIKILYGIYFGPESSAGSDAAEWKGMSFKVQMWLRTRIGSGSREEIKHHTLVRTASRTCEWCQLLKN